MAENSKSLRILPIILVIFLALFFACGLLYYQYWYLPNKSKNIPDLNGNNYQKEPWKTYNDEAFGFSFHYPSNLFKFEEKEAVFNVSEENSVKGILVARNIPITISFVSHTTPDGEYIVYVNPLEMTVSVIKKPATFFGLDYFANDEKDKCEDGLNKGPEVSCTVSNVKINGAHGIKLKAATTNSTREVLYITEPGKNYILKIEYYFNGSELSGGTENKDSILRYNIIQSIISKGFIL